MYPKRVDRFTQWSKDMVQGAIVDRPRLTGKKHRSKRKRVSRRNRRNNAKKD